MPTWPVHLKIANRLAKKYNYTDDFIIGNVLPDTMNGFVVSNPSNIFHHSITHYSEKTDIGIPKINIDNFLKDNKDKLNNELILGTYAHLLADLYFNKYTMENHMKLVDDKIVPILNDGNKDEEHPTMHIKHEDFRILGESFIRNKEVGDEISITKDTINLSKDLNYEVQKEDLLKTVEKINELIGLETKEEEYKMFTEKELIDLFNSCLEYVDKNINESKEGTTC